MLSPFPFNQKDDNEKHRGPGVFDIACRNLTPVDEEAIYLEAERIAYSLVCRPGEPLVTLWRKHDDDRETIDLMPRTMAKLEMLKAPFENVSRLRIVGNRSEWYDERLDSPDKPLKPREKL